MKGSLFLLILAAFMTLCLGRISWCDEKAEKAEGWTMYYKSDSGEAMYYDKTTIKKLAKDIIRVSQRTTMKTGKDEEEQETCRAEIEINCKKRTYTVLSYSEGKAASDKKCIDKKGTHRLYLDSTMGALYENLCE